MSHFCVIVVGNNIEKQLEPYQENNMGDCPKEYLEFFDEEAELLREYEEFEKENYPTFEDFAKRYFGYYKRDPHMNLYGHWENPNAKWDYYIIGGRWKEFFPLKKGKTGKIAPRGEAFSEKDLRYTSGQTRADQAKLCDIDFNHARDAAEKEARASFAVWKKCFEKHGKTKSFEELKECYPVKNVSELHFLYKDQPAIKAFRNEGYFIEPVTQIGYDEEVYVEKIKNKTLVPFAFVKNSVWHEKGKMGFFGMSTDEIAQSDWNTKFHKMLSELEPNTLLTMVDCHI